MVNFTLDLLCGGRVQAVDGFLEEGPFGHELVEDHLLDRALYSKVIGGITG